MPEQWWSNLTTASWRFQKVLDGTERDPLNPTYTCVVKMISRGQYITWKKALREGIGIKKKYKEYSEESLKNKRTELVSKEEINSYSSVNPSINVCFNSFSFRVNLVLEHPRSTNFIVWAFNVRTQYQFGVVTNWVLTIGAVCGKGLCVGTGGGRIELLSNKGLRKPFHHFQQPVVVALI